MCCFTTHKRSVLREFRMGPRCSFAPEWARLLAQAVNNRVGGACHEPTWVLVDQRSDLIALWHISTHLSFAPVHMCVCVCQSAHRLCHFLVLDPRPEKQLGTLKKKDSFLTLHETWPQKIRLELTMLCITSNYIDCLLGYQPFIAGASGEHPGRTCLCTLNWAQNLGLLFLRKSSVLRTYPLKCLENLRLSREHTAHGLKL